MVRRGLPCRRRPNLIHGPHQLLPPRDHVCPPPLPPCSIQQSAALALGRLANYSDDLAEAVVQNEILPQLVGRQPLAWAWAGPAVMLSMPWGIDAGGPSPQGCQGLQGHGDRNGQGEALRLFGIMGTWLACNARVLTTAAHTTCTTCT